MRLNTMKSAVLFSLTAFLVSFSSLPSLASNSLATANDLTGTLGCPDPGTIVKCNGVYYTWGTMGGGLKSSDRKNWASAGYRVAPSQSWWSPHGNQMWAPDVSYFNGKYYCFYSVCGSEKNCAVGLTTSPTLDPATAVWTDQGIVVDSVYANNGSWVNAIDPSTFVDDDGKWYLAFGSFQNGVRLGELNPATGKIISTEAHPTKISNHAGEASALIKWKTYYYYAISQGKCCANMTSTYYITYSRATAVKGPYANKSGGTFMTSAVEKLLHGSNDSNATTGVVAVGVGGFFWDGKNGLDTLFMDYMGYTAPSGSPLLYIKPLYADASGWLTFEAGKGTIMTRPTPAVSIKRYNMENPNPLQSFRAPVAVRLMGAGNSGIKPAGQLYSIMGQSLNRRAIKGIPAGIYIDRQVSGRL